MLLVLHSTSCLDASKPNTLCTYIEADHARYHSLGPSKMYTAIRTVPTQPTSQDGSESRCLQPDNLPETYPAGLRRLMQNASNSSASGDVFIVTSALEFIQAARSGAAHIEMRSHMSFSALGFSFYQRNQTSDGQDDFTVDIRPSIKSIRVRCCRCLWCRHCSAQVYRSCISYTYHVN